MGSSYFFKDYPNFMPHDIDYVEVTDDEMIKGMMIIRGKGEDVFIFRRKSKEDFIKDALKSTAAMVLGKFLIPEFCDEIGFTIEDLPRLEPLVINLDDKHKYEEIIYSAYLKNQSFTLTKKQRNAAFESYKNSRRYIRL